MLDKAEPKQVDRSSASPARSKKLERRRSQPSAKKERDAVDAASASASEAARIASPSPEPRDGSRCGATSRWGATTMGKRSVPDPSAVRSSKLTCASGGALCTLTRSAGAMPRAQRRSASDHPAALSQLSIESLLAASSW
jgi:hypothetical protein